MRYVLLLLAVLATPAQAEEDGRDLLERGAQLLLEGLLREIEPALNDLEALGAGIGPALRDFVTQMGPALQDLMLQVEDWSAYHPPEIMDNGDIIIRRKIDIPDGEEFDI